MKSKEYQRKSAFIYRKTSRPQQPERGIKPQKPAIPAVPASGRPDRNRRASAAYQVMYSLETWLCILHRVSVANHGPGPCSGADLAGAGDLVFITGQLWQAHGTARVELVGADADFTAEAEFPAVVEAGAGVP